MKRAFLISIFLVVVTPVINAESKPFVYNDHGRRDPFWPIVSSSGAINNYETDFMITDLVLEGIMSGPDGRNFAMINGRVVSLNDSIGQFMVTEIGENSVVLKKGEQKFRMKLKKEE